MGISVTLVQLIWVLAKCFRREMMVWSVLGRLTPTQPLVMQSDAIRGRGGPKGLISTYTFLFTASWNESIALYRFMPCVRVHTLAQISATTDSVNRHERHTVGDLFKFNKARWIVGRCIGFFYAFYIDAVACVHVWVCVHVACFTWVCVRARCSPQVVWWCPPAP